jgi:Pyridoxamine 5'-phosphate oxidase
MASWNDVVAAEPDFADHVRRTFAVRKHATLATLRRDGSPRISGTEVQFDDDAGEIYLGMMAGSLKALDLRRNPRLALHCPTVDTPEDDAESTEIAGVIALSPAKGEAPRIPSAISASGAPPRLSLTRCRSEVSAKMPPSPRSSARMTKLTYLSDTMIMSDQNTSDITPYTEARVTCTAWLSTVKTAWIAYSGLVPMSPNTTPSEPSVSARHPRSFRGAASTFRSRPGRPGRR